MEKQIDSYCNTCVGARKHHILHEEYEKGSEEVDGQYSVEWGTKHRMIKCCGCGSVSMRKDSWFSEHVDDFGRPEIQTSYFPPRIYKRKPTWLEGLTVMFNGIPSEITSLLEEVYICLGNNCARTATMGCRSLLESIFIEKIGKDLGTFGKNLDAFHDLGHISQTQKKIINDVLEAGHASTHRGFKPTNEEIATIVSIVENLMEIIYVHQIESAQLRQRIPDRNKTKPPKKPSK